MFYLDSWPLRVFGRVHQTYPRRIARHKSSWEEQHSSINAMQELPGLGAFLASLMKQEHMARWRATKCWDGAKKWRHAREMGEAAAVTNLAAPRGIAVSDWGSGWGTKRWAGCEGVWVRSIGRAGLVAQMRAPKTHATIFGFFSAYRGEIPLSFRRSAPCVQKSGANTNSQTRVAYIMGWASTNQSCNCSKRSCAHSGLGPPKNKRAARVGALRRAAHTPQTVLAWRPYQRRGPGPRRAPGS